MLLSAALLVLMQNPSTAASVWGSVLERYAAEKPGFLKETNVDNSGIAFNWSLGVALSAENALAKLNPENIPRLRNRLEAAMTYWNPVGPYAGFDVLPGPPFPNDRYYDDNAWMVMALVEGYEITGEERWLNQAKQALRYVMSGEDSTLGGGIYWREIDKPSKNTCSNGPAAAASLAVYEHTREQSLLEDAKRIYGWTKKHLQDPRDHLYWDAIGKDGRINQTKWSYNSALMLRAAKQLSEIAPGEGYDKDAELLEAACIHRWVKEDGSIDDELPFAHLLFENLDPNIFDAERAIGALLRGRDDTGNFGRRWGVSPSTGPRKLIDQASASRALAMYELNQSIK
ncbi:MAG: hypothetical protein KF812_05450 [Fimbriimonadaceae bacterium]|nr:hypothetical protein [Fimbriimonadaceae bacterium]